MTIIAAARIDGKTIIGGDTLLSTSTRRSSKVTKLFKFNNFIIGCAGTGTILHILADFHKHNRLKAAPRNANSAYKLTRPIFKQYAETLKELLTFSKSDEDGCSLLIATRSAIFVADEYSVESFTDYAAIGSGENFALGAFFASYPHQDCVRKALEAAIKYDLSCGGDYITQWIN